MTLGQEAIRSGGIADASLAKAYYCSGHFNTGNVLKIELDRQMPRVLVVLEVEGWIS